MIRKIAFICKSHIYFNQNALNSFIKEAKNYQLECNLYNNSEALTDSKFIPDCVLILDGHEAKLTPYPTYAIIDREASFIVSKKRLVRNILMYDGYLTFSPFTKEVLGDLMFSARKLGSTIADFKIIPASNSVKNNIDFSNVYIAYVDNCSELINKNLIKRLRKKSIIKYYKNQDSLPKLSENYDPESIKIYRENALGLCLFAGEDWNKNVSYQLLEIIASGALAITNYSQYLYSIFGDNILYLPNEYGKKLLSNQLEKHTKWVRANPEIARKKAENANKIYNDLFSWKKNIENLQKLHNQTLVNKGYIAREDEDRKKFPSVSYIMRTGGNPKYINQTLDSLVAQNYQNLQIILVLYEPLNNLEQIKNKYEKYLQFKVIEDFKKLRSTGIITGMKNVDSEYFAIIDDDDMIHPNHVYSLVKTLEYHNKFSTNKNIRLAYSCSYYVSDFMKFPEDIEWHDELLESAPKKRAVEHFRFYDANLIMSHLWYMMSNSWLAHKSLIDEEILRDIFTHSHEDLYFEMQFAMRTDFAFSCEMTAIHNFHGANSTILDKTRNQYDVFRRNLSLHFRRHPINKFCRPDHGYPHSNIMEINMPNINYPRYLEAKRKKIKLPFARSKKVAKFIRKIKNFRI